MAIKPILFNTEMVRAILDGRKTCTRRLVKFLPGENSQWTGYIKDGLMLYNGRNEPCIRKVPYQPGDIMYVRETWQYLYELDGNEQIIEGTGKYYYAATDTIPFDTYVDASGVTHERVPWHPSIHMPKEAARIWLKVTDVRVERLQEITEECAKKEGAIDNRGFIHSPDNEYDSVHTAREHFAEIWDSTIKKSDLDRYGWNANPWVWVIEFERCEKPEGV
nr:MAG TPA: ASCH domain protein [Caudoviricetes sp.]